MAPLPRWARPLLYRPGMTRPGNRSQLRITRHDLGRRNTTLRLEGRLDESDWDALAAARGECSDRRVALDLSGLAFLAWDTAQRLVALRREGVDLLGGSGFVRELLRSAASEARSEPEASEVRAHAKAGEARAAEESA